jgi:Acetyltransferase (GNAT) domain
LFAASRGRNALWVKGEIFRNLDDVTLSSRGELDRAAQVSMFDRLDWFRRSYLLTKLPGNPLITRARADASDCWLFLMQRGSSARALASWYTLSFRPVFTGDPNDATKFALLLATARRLTKRLSQIKLSPMPEKDARIVAKAFDRARWIPQVRETTVNWTVDTDDLSFEEYWAQRPGELRSTVKRKAAKYEIKTKIYPNFETEAWASYETIYAASWKPEEGSVDFLRDMALNESAAGALRIGVATIAGEPVAAQLWTVENGRAIIHKLAYLESAAAQSPGSVLTAAMFEHVIDQDRVKIVDFGTGDDRYKADWMDRREPLYTVELFNPRHPAGLWAAIKAWFATLVGR